LLIMNKEQHPIAQLRRVPQRYDRPGHLDPAHAERLRDLSRAGREEEDDGAFLRASAEEDDVASDLGEAAVANMTGGDADVSNRIEARIDEELAGRFAETFASEDVGEEDMSIPLDIDRELTPPRPNPQPDEPDEPDEPREPNEPDEFDEEQTRPIVVRSWGQIYLPRARKIAGWVGRRVRDAAGALVRGAQRKIGRENAS
jgi:hypothetical protein